jgi:diketogulonate reductase-like aldo/keto reductase
VTHPAIARIADASGLTAAQTVFRFAQLKGVIPLSGTTDKTHMRQDVDIEHHTLKEEGLESSWAAVKQILAE